MQLPKATVVVPVFNKEKSIENCLHSIFQQDYLGELEIIMVDDDSRDGSWEIVKRFSDKLHAAVKNSKNRGPAYCRNLGSKLSSGEIIFFLDADGYASASWISEGIKNFTDPNCIGVEGHIIAQPPENELRDRKVINPFYADNKNEIHRDYPAGNIAYRRKELLEVGGFNEKRYRNGREDTDLAFRMLKLGRINFDQKMEVTFQTEHWKMATMLKNAHRYYYDVVFLKDHQLFKFKEGRIIHPQLLRYLLKPFSIRATHKSCSNSDLLKFYIYLVLLRVHVWRAALREKIVVF